MWYFRCWAGCWWSTAEVPLDEQGVPAQPSAKILRSDFGLLLAMDDTAQTITLSDDAGLNLMRIKVLEGTIQIQSAVKVVLEAPLIQHGQSAAHPAVFGDLLLAFDTAARISGNPVADVDDLEYLLNRRASPRVSALTAVAVAAARRGEGQLALRAARTIMNPGGRAAAYREIALAFPIENQEAKLGAGAIPMHPDEPSPQQISPAVKGAPAPAAR